MKDKISKYLLIGVACIFLGLSTASCGLMHSVFDDKVVTTLDNVKADVPREHIAVAPTEGIISNEQHQRLQDSGKEVVIVGKADVIDPSKAVEVTNPNADSLGGILDIGLQIAKVFLPGIAGLEGLGVLFSQRKRSHYADAVRAILPTNGSVDVAESLVAVAKALGFTHSSAKTKEEASKPA